MKKSTVTKLINDLVCRIVFDRYAYKDGEFYTLWETDATMQMGSCLGKMRFVLEGDEIVSTGYPMLGLTNDFQEISLETINGYGKIYGEYLEMKNSN